MTQADEIQRLERELAERKLAVREHDLTEREQAIADRERKKRQSELIAREQALAEREERELREYALSLTDELEIVARDGRATVRQRVSPREALDLALNLLERGARKMVTEEGARVPGGYLWTLGTESEGRGPRNPWGGATCQFVTKLKRKISLSDDLEISIPDSNVTVCLLLSPDECFALAADLLHRAGRQLQGEQRKDLLKFRVHPD